MGFFDLNIPYPEPSPPNNKSTIESNRTKLAVKAMELGYTGIAYNRTMKGVMSDHHRCSISPLSLSSLLKVLPSLSLSAKLHRDLLGIPLTTPFRQYTRLTVIADSPSQAQSLNSGNPILKTYDLVAVKPLNQTAFDLACQTMEVDIISMDFSTKLPFRLKQPMIKAAVQRGVYFEVKYSGLITDVQIRRQFISSAKLLVDWTRGRNIVFSSAAPSVNELRGPCDVANLLSLLGLSKEHAKAAISKNCSVLLANSLRKKRFYKEAIRVEVLSDSASHSKEAWYQELLNWDPISSGDGDILLDEMEKSCSASCKASKTAKAIDFVSVVNSIPSHGFQVKDFLPASNAFPVFPENKVNVLPIPENVNQSTPLLNNSTEQPNRLDVCPEQGESSLSDDVATHQVLSCDNLFEDNIQGGTTEAFNSKEEMDPLINATKLELDNSVEADVDYIPFEAKAHDLQSDLCVSSNELDTVIPYENEKPHISSEDAKRDDAHKIDHKVEIITPSMDNTFPALVHGKHNHEKSSGVNLNTQIAKMHEAWPKEDLKIAEHRVLETNTSISENLMKGEISYKRETDAVELDEMLQQTPYDEMKIEDDSSVATHLLPDLMMEDKKPVEVSTESNQVASVQSVSGRLRVKRRTPRGPLLLPFKPLLNAMPFKKKGKKIKSRTKLK